MRRLRWLLCAVGLGFGGCILSPIEDLPSGHDDSAPNNSTGGVTGTGSASTGSGGVLGTGGGGILPGAGGNHDPSGEAGGGGLGGAGGETR